eukprot:SAG31_NODE_4178_length_3499_cov_13.432941_2_plen_101_part_00
MAEDRCRHGRRHFRRFHLLTEEAKNDGEAWCEAQSADPRMMTAVWGRCMVAIVSAILNCRICCFVTVVVKAVRNPVGERTCFDEFLLDFLDLIRHVLVMY